MSPNWLNGARPEDYAVAEAVELAIEVAWDEGDPRALAVALEANALLGFHDGSVMLSRPGLTVDAVLERLAASRRGRPRRLLRADARGMLQGFYVLAQNDILKPRAASEAIRQRWLARGGYGQALSNGGEKG